MTRKRFWEKWKLGWKIIDSDNSFDQKKVFMSDLKLLISRHQEPFINALENIASEIEGQVTEELRSAKYDAQRLS